MAQDTEPDDDSDEESLDRDSDTECVPYDYAPLSGHLSSFPTPWEPASILPSDTKAKDEWNSISGSIPTKILQKAGLNAFVSYDSVDDPDCWWTMQQCVKPKLKGIPSDVIDVPEPNTIGYGFDDGPSCSNKVFYDFLKNKNQKATMFFIGSNVLYLPLETQRALTDGHEVCVHTWSHSYMTALSSQDAFAELYYMVKLVTGVTPTCWRPPYGDVDDRIRAIANAMGLRTILWNYDSDDWTDDEVRVNKNYGNLIKDSKNGIFNKSGVILLTHELDNFTMGKAIEYYPQLKSVFKYVVPIGVALNKTQPYTETNRSLPTFEQCECISIYSIK
ncbi:carbohydrate esterase family 4 protein [Crucibulum laeve]|uniref:chitin deacetylase n=1 Tax=Crucibulum laeve TaxID=68775 RepID=A0A5C3M003_9AGAR|nr:carbohydrate esterase family 4 protein [Crucibulum laeve]